MTNNDQNAKADAGKLQLSLVDTDAIKTIATLEKHDQDERSRHTLEFVRKLDSVDSESGIAHYKHMACNMAFICEMMGGNVPQKCETVEEILAREG